MSNIEDVDKRPENGFFLFRTDVQYIINKNDRNMKATEISGIVGRIWNEVKTNNRTCKKLQAHYHYLSEKKKKVTNRNEPFDIHIMKLDDINDYSEQEITEELIKIIKSELPNLKIQHIRYSLPSLCNPSKGYFPHDDNNTHISASFTPEVSTSTSVPSVCFVSNSPNISLSTSGSTFNSASSFSALPLYSDSLHVLPPLSPSIQEIPDLTSSFFSINTHNLSLASTTISAMTNKNSEVNPEEDIPTLSKKREGLVTQRKKVDEEKKELMRKRKRIDDEIDELDSKVNRIMEQLRNEYNEYQKQKQEQEQEQVQVKEEERIYIID
ncbi:10785_t:CDS:2 [Acaulospora morrowiae]|uniref:10785_t:CDS:1 n=1 Tax=Acaulospora morrowiae TaxID=94023 RepID=A0A9N8V6U0_9GLOM|nr:10785_t:CDS:2 [Acaulospora morrowiae]